jgi:hypothetical protein
MVRGLQLRLCVSVVDSLPAFAINPNNHQPSTISMLTQLDTIKTRLLIDLSDPQYDTILTNTILSVSARFDAETNRTLARTESLLFEFPGEDVELILPCYPVEGVSKFELKSNEADGWVEQEDVEFLIRRSCLISLASPLGSWRDQGRITYTAGYVLPGATPDPGQTALPADLEQAAVEQVAYWFMNRDKLGLLRSWPHLGTYEQLSGADLLPSVQNVLQKHKRWAI